MVIEPKTTVRSAVIWLHGLGADAHDFEGVVPFLPTQQRGMRMIFPNAPVRPISVNMGMPMRAWYDISDINLRNADRVSIEQSNQTVQALVESQIEAGIDSKKIVVAGFSQGGAIALHAGTRCPHQLAGIMGLSCYLLDKDNHTKERRAINQQTPIWMAHGEYDPMVPYQLGKSGAQFLSDQGHHVTFVSYPIGHEVSMPEITALSRWLSEVLA